MALVLSVCFRALSCLVSWMAPHVHEEESHVSNISCNWLDKLWLYSIALRASIDQGLLFLALSGQ